MLDQIKIRLTQYQDELELEQKQARDRAAVPSSREARSSFAIITELEAVVISHL